MNYIYKLLHSHQFKPTEENKELLVCECGETKNIHIHQLTESKNKKLLDSFTIYCKMYPELRFWQALRNWAGVPFIGISNGKAEGEKKAIWVDTFYSNNQNGS